MNQLEVKIASKRGETQNICVLTLTRTDGALLPPFSAGSHIDVHLPGGLIRQYSLCGVPSEKGLKHYQLGVLRTEDSKGGSKAVHEQLSEGDVIKISTPRNLFPLDGSATQSLLIAGGIGVTPILSMAEQLSLAEQPFAMHYFTRSASHTAFDRHLKQSPFAKNVQLHTGLTSNQNRDVIKGLLESPVQCGHVYVCGPAKFIELVLETARNAGWPEAQLHFELFSAKPVAVTEGDVFTVKLAKSGHTVSVEAGQTVVEALAQVGVEIQTSCGQGICGTCLTTVLEGEPRHLDQYLTEEEQALNNQFTPCCSRSNSPMLVLDL